ncbi:MAG: MFS transporter [Desulfotomaculum sp.]|nr:MFS transporter [Desulfotomaculum sp.]
MKEHARASAVLFFTLFLVMVGFGIIIPIIPFYLTELGGGPTSLGLFMATYPLMQFFFAPLWGRLSDRIGRRPVLLIGLSGYGITFILLGYASQLWMLFVIRILSGLISSATLPTAMAYIADITRGENRSRGMGVMGAAMGGGMIFGPALGGWLGHYGYSLPFLAAGGLAILNLPFAFFFLPESLKKLRKRPSGGAGINLDMVHHPLRVFFVLTFVMHFTMAMFQSTFVLLAADKLGFGPKEMGNVFAVLGAIGVIIQGGAIGRLVAKFGDAGLIKGGLLISALGMFLIILAGNSILMFITTAVFSIGNSLIGPTSFSLVTRNTTQGQGAAVGTMQSFGSLGRTLGPVAGGVLYDINMVIPFILGAVILLVLLVMTRRKINEFDSEKAG